MPMTDARIESFLADVLALEGENPEAIREGVHIALADCGEIYRAQEALSGKCNGEREQRLQST